MQAVYLLMAGVTQPYQVYQRFKSKIVVTQVMHFKIFSGVASTTEPTAGFPIRIASKSPLFGLDVS